MTTILAIILTFLVLFFIGILIAVTEYAGRIIVSALALSALIIGALL